MLRLTRGIELLVYNDGQLAIGQANSLAARAMSLKLWVTFSGRPDDQSGMLVNVRDIDAVLRDDLANREVVINSVIDVADWAWSVLDGTFGPGLSVSKVEVDVDESLRVSRDIMERDMVRVTRKYALAAAHCLRHDQWDDARNESVFGKCSNPRGHGHNYSLEVTVRAVGSVEMSEMDRVVSEKVVARFDHKHLNEDCPEFADLLPTVENMVKVFWALLDGRFGSDVELFRIAVWETPKTYAEYFGNSIV